MEKGVKSRVKTTEKSESWPKNLSKTKVTILELIREKPTITYVQLSEALGISEKSIYEHMVALQEMKILRRKGTRQDGEWVFVEAEKEG